MLFDVKYDKFGYKSMLHNSMAIVLHNSINKESYDKLDLITEQAIHLGKLGEAMASVVITKVNRK